MLSENHLRLAAKFGREPNRPADRYHPLICHMLDVAAVAEALWDTALSPAMRGFFQEGLEVRDDDTARRWIAFLAGLHDLGKACPAFQHKYDRQHIATRLAGFPLGQPVGSAADPGHAAVTGAACEKLFEDRLKVRPDAATKLAEVLAGHHGWFPPEFWRAAGDRIGERDRAAHAAYEEARAALFDELAALLGVAPGSLTIDLPSLPVSLALAGFVSIADWIGSQETFFPYAPGTSDTTAYLQRARAAARDALQQLGWTAAPQPPGPRSFADLFPGRNPRPLQEAVEQTLREPPPRFTIIEAPTGEGKTEAALQIVDAWAGHGRPAAYLALPTQATANQLHGRARSFLETAYPGQPVNLQLVHGGVLLDSRTVEPGMVADDAAGPDEAGVRAAEWFLPRRRAILAPWGVGTIDQALLAALPVKFLGVRHFGLAGKVLVVDEVHAYDTYMTGLLERLLEWMGAYGVPVVLLSATLPAGRRAALMNAYAAGRGVEPLWPTDQPARYPLITALQADGAVVSRPFDASRPASLGVDWVSADPAATVQLLSRQLRDGGCAAVMCNTVARAQEMFRALQVHFGDDVQLFHARFTARDRDRLERACLAAFGPPGTGERPHRRVLVATQVVEQSLDLDFDVMVSDFAPVDLLLQRAGRLQRHDRGQRPWPRTLHLRLDLDADGFPAFDDGTTAVYDEHILLRTWLQLRGRPGIALPGDVADLVDAVYADDDTPPVGLEPALETRWAATHARLREAQASLEGAALHARIRKPEPGQFLADLANLSLEEDRPDLPRVAQALTRLAEPSVPLILLGPGETLPSADQLTFERVRDLLERSLTVSGWYARVLREALSVPPAFARKAALRDHRPVWLDAEGRAEVAGLELSYSPITGLEVTKRP